MLRVLRHLYSFMRPSPRPNLWFVCLCLTALILVAVTSSAAQSTVFDEPSAGALRPERFNPLFGWAANGSHAYVLPQALPADGVSEATVWVYWVDSSGNPVTGKEEQVKVAVRNQGRGVTVGDVTEVQEGYYAAQVTSTRPGSTYAVVRLGNQILPMAPAIHFSAASVVGGAVKLTRSHDSVTYVASGSPVLIDPNMNIAGIPMDVSLAGVRVAITDGYVEGDELGFMIDGVYSSTYSANGITSSFSPESGALSLAGPATAYDFMTVLRSIAYKTVANEPSAFAQPRTITFTLILAGATYDPDTGHYYQYVDTPMTWLEAELDAAQRSLYGLQGYLATITSARENAVVWRVARAQEVWIGAADDHWVTSFPHDGAFVWRWVAGPEAGVQFNYKKNPLPGYYTNWNNRAPRGASPHDYVYMDTDGTWDDAKASEKRGFVVEYGGLPGGAAQLTQTVVVEMQLSTPTPTAAFSYAPEVPRIGEPIQFTSHSTGEGLTYTWSFGDGTQSTSASDPIHTFAAPGTYRVRLTVEDALGQQDTAEQLVQVRADLVGYVYHDTNGNGAHDLGEPGLGRADVQIALVQHGLVIATAPDHAFGHTFDPTIGYYRFSGLAAGTYEVMVVELGEPDRPYTPPGWLYTGERAGFPAATFGLSLLPVVGVGTVQGPSFGFAPGFVVQGTVFQDDGGATSIANDGSKGATEQGVAGMRLRAVRGSSIVGTTLSDAQGNYTLTVPGEEVDAHIRLVLGAEGSYRTTGYTPGTSAPSVQLDAFQSQVEVPINPGIHEGYDFGLVPRLTWTSIDAGTAARGGLRAYPFSLTLGTVGTVSFDVASPRGWDYTVYIDADGDGLIDSEDKLVTGKTELLGPGRIGFILLVRVPSTEVDGAADAARIAASLTYAGNERLNETATMYAVTAVQSGNLELEVGVRNQTTSYPPGLNNYSTRQVEARSGDLLEYRIAYANRGTATVSDVIVRAAIPYGMHLKQDAYGPNAPVRWEHHSGTGIQTPSVTQSGPTLILHVGSVLPGQQGSFTYQVVLD